MKNLTDCQAAYIAGFIDGEGTIGIAKHKTKDTNAGHYYTYYLTIPNTDLNVLTWLKQIIGTGTLSVTAEQKGKYSKAWKLGIPTYDIMPLVKTIMPHLIVKRKQAQILFEYEETGNNYSRWNPIPENVQALRDVLYDEMTLLNKRGV